MEFIIKSSISTIYIYISNSQQLIRNRNNNIFNILSYNLSSRTKKRALHQSQYYT